LQEAKRWWDHWLKGIDNGAEDLPAYRAWLMDSIAPERWVDQRPGRWIAEAEWPSGRVCRKSLLLGDGSLGQGAMSSLWQFHRRSIAAAEAGEYFPFAYGPELPDEQTPDDRRSACFDGAVEETLDIVGAPRLTIRAELRQAFGATGCAALRPASRRNIGADHHGRAQPHRTSQVEAPERCSHPVRCSRHHRARSDRLPDSRRTSPADRGFDQLLAVHLAVARTRNVSLEAGKLELPVRTMLADQDECSFEKPVGAEPWRHENLRPSQSVRSSETDPETGVVKTVHLQRCR
jgi:hypothetical protein